MAYIKNGAPQVIHLGADDKSGRIVTPSSEPIPQHCPLFYIFAEKGPADRLLLSASKLETVYGSKTFNVNEKFYNHQTRGLLGVEGQANSCIIKRLIPNDAGIKANRITYIDVLETNIPNYVRDSYGSYVVDPNTNAYKVDKTTPTVSGYKIKFIAEELSSIDDIKLLKPKDGTMSVTTSMVPTIQDAVVGSVNGLKAKYKIGDEIKIKEVVTGENFTIESSNPAVIEYNVDEDKYYAKGKGTSTITVNFAETDTKTASNIKVNVTVVETDVNEAVNVNVNGVLNLLTQEITSFDVEVTGDNSTNAVITVNNKQIANVNDTTVTATKNGVTYVNVFIPATNDKEGITFGYTLQSKVEKLPAVETTVKSTMYPFVGLVAKNQGAYYNGLGFGIGSITGDELDTKIVSSTKAMPYRLAFYTRSSSTTSPSQFRSLYGEPYVQFSPKDKAINPNTDAKFDFETVVENNWWNETDDLKSLRYEDYETIHFFREYFEELCKMFLAKEKQFVSDEDKRWDNGKSASSSSWYDFTTSDQNDIDEEYLIMNPLSCRTSQNINYFTLVKDNETNPVLKDNQKEVLMSLDSPVFLQGGSDGTISNEEFEKLVVEDMKQYSDADSELQDLAVNVESTFYDTGFTLNTKKELINFITLRKDTDIVLSTHDDSLGEKTLPLSDARAVAEALKARYKLAPESEYFGTTVARGVVVMGSGKLRDGSTKNRIPITYELAVKAASMMGSSTGVWDSKKIFDNYPGNAIEYLIDPQPSFIPAGIKPTLWNEGVVWVQPYDRSSYHIPALQTIYEDDTSVLNNFFVMKALGQLTKLSDRVWRKFTGTSKLSNAEFIEAVTEYCNKLLKGIFDNVVTVIPEVIIDDEDELRGYSWHVVWKLYGDNMKTVLVASTEVYRSSDLNSAE